MTILLVDDEILICNWISVVISKLGRPDVATVSLSSAEEALLYCENHSVDLVLTDITMPQKSGLDLIEELSRTHPEIKTAVLSAYDDYKYIREAFKLGALDYILKAEIKTEDIVSLLNKLQLFSPLHLEKSQRDLESISHSAVLQNRFQDLLSETISEVEFFAETSLAPEVYDTGICLFHLNKSANADLDLSTLLDILSRTLQGESLIGNTFIVKNNCFACLFNIPNAIPEYQQNLMNKLMLLGQRNINEYSSFSVSDCLFTSAVAPASIRQELSKALQTLDSRSYHRDDSSFNSIALPGDAIETLNTSLINSLTLGKYGEALDQLQTFTNNAHALFWDPRQLRAVLVYAVTVMYSFLNRHPTTKQLFGNYEQFIKSISQAPSAEALVLALQSFKASYLRCVDTDARQISAATQQIVNYINEHYMDKLTLESISEHVFLHKAYVSQLFSKQMNMSLGTYIEKLRVQHAKSLLATTDLSIYQISEQTGYSSQSYFTKVFKKETGISPAKYRSLFFEGNDLSESIQHTFFS